MGDVSAPHTSRRVSGWVAGALLPGDTVAGYRIESELGRGGMATVYRAVHPFLGSRVAIKVLRARPDAEPAQEARFIQEARVASQVRHPNLVEVFAFGRLADGALYYVMEALEGETLRVLVKR